MITAEVRNYMARRAEIKKVFKVLYVLFDIQVAWEYLENQMDMGRISEYDGDAIYNTLGDLEGANVTVGEIENLKSKILSLYV